MTKKKDKDTQPVESLSAPSAPTEDPGDAVEQAPTEAAAPEAKSTGEKQYARCKAAFSMYFHGSRVQFEEGKILRDPGQIQRAVKQHKPIEFVDTPY